MKSQKCKYCKKDGFTKGIIMHERHCKENPDNKNIEKQNEGGQALDAPAKTAERSIYWGYKVVTILIFVAAILQYFIIDFFHINKWLLLIIYLFYLLIYIFIIWTIWRLRKKQEIVIFNTIEEFMKEVPRWSLSEKPPNKGIIGSILNMGKEYKQIVQVSKNFEPKMLWSEWNGFLFSINNRAYKPPQGSIRGDVFFYNRDKMCPLIDTAETTTEDAEDSFQLDAVWNQGVAVGHAAAMSKAQGQIQLIIILVVIILASLIIYDLYSYSQFSTIKEQVGTIRMITTNISQIVGG